MSTTTSEASYGNHSTFIKEYFPPPPRIINATRLFLPYKGYVDIGLTPESDGYGNANVTVTIVIAYGRQWLALNPQQVAEFFVTVREIDSFGTVDGQCYFDHEDSFNGKFRMQNNIKFLEVEFTDEEGDRSRINEFDKDDVVGLLTMERVISQQITAVNTTMKDAIEEIEDIAFKCRGDAAAVKHMAEVWHCGKMAIEMAINHFTFFYSFVKELETASDDE